MILKYLIAGETPAKKNSRITLKNGKTIPSKRYQEWHSEAMIQLYKQGKPAFPINQKSVLFLKFTHGDLRRRDSDNGCSSILDLLQDAEIIADDNWEIISEIYIRNFYDKGKPKVEIELMTI